MVPKSPIWSKIRHIWKPCFWQPAKTLEEKTKPRQSWWSSGQPWGTKRTSESNSWHLQGSEDVFRFSEQFEPDWSKIIGVCTSPMNGHDGRGHQFWIKNGMLDQAFFWPNFANPSQLELADSWVFWVFPWVFWENAWVFLWFSLSFWCFMKDFVSSVEFLSSNAEKISNLLSNS